MPESGHPMVSYHGAIVAAALSIDGPTPGWLPLGGAVLRKSSERGLTVS